MTCNYILTSMWTEPWLERSLILGSTSCIMSWENLTGGCHIHEVIDEHFPKGFKNMFPTTRLTLDATEVPIQRPQNCDAQRITFSTYKHRNTAKTMIGVT